MTVITKEIGILTALTVFTIHEELLVKQETHPESSALWGSWIIS